MSAGFRIWPGGACISKYRSAATAARFAEKAAVNAREEILRSTTAEQRRSKTLSWLQEALQLTEFPHRIEAYDISNTGSTGIVASMTVHVDGKPLKRDYRKFRIRSTETPDDYGSMREVITRRFTHYLDEDGKFSARPDVLFIDGGAGARLRRPARRSKRWDSACRCSAW